MIDQKMSDLVAEWQGRAFQWGVSDCCQFARAAAWQLHGIVVDSPAYISERDALRAWRAKGGYHGLFRAAGLVQRRAHLAARRGDCVLVDVADRALFPQGLALVTGPAAHMPGAHGLVSVPRSAWREVWGVA
jgi:hypothetical protein